MIQIPDGVQATYDAWLETEGVLGGDTTVTGGGHAVP